MYNFSQSANKISWFDVILTSLTGTTTDRAEYCLSKAPGLVKTLIRQITCIDWKTKWNEPCNSRYPGDDCHSTDLLPDTLVLLANLIASLPQHAGTVRDAVRLWDHCHDDMGDVIMTNDVTSFCKKSEWWQENDVMMTWVRNDNVQAMESDLLDMITPGKLLDKYVVPALVLISSTWFNWTDVSFPFFFHRHDLII